MAGHRVVLGTRVWQGLLTEGGLRGVHRDDGG